MQRSKNRIILQNEWAVLNGIAHFQKEEKYKSLVVELKAVMLICVACGNGSFVLIMELSKQLGGIYYAQ